MARYRSATKNPVEHFGTKKAFAAYKTSLNVILSNMFDFAYLPKGEGMGWTQKQLAKKSNISESTLARLYYKLEYGESIRCYFDTVWKICYALGYNLEVTGDGLNLKIRKKAA